MKTKHGLFFGFAVLLAAAMFFPMGCDNSSDGGGGGGDSSFVGTWQGVDSDGDVLSLVINANKTWECTDYTANLKWKGTYTSSGNTGSMTITQTNQGSGWQTVSGYGTGQLSVNTLSVVFVITGFGSITATFTR
jgi:hypothetical protein